VSVLEETAARLASLDFARVRRLAAYIRRQISLAERPPVGRIELNNEEAAICADALEILAAHEELARRGARP
jgi:hypothetical protein